MCAASIAPSASKAIVTAACSCRDWPAAMRFSRRSSTHFTGAPALGAASTRHMSSRNTMTFCPKPPPVSRITTRMRCFRGCRAGGHRTTEPRGRLRRCVDRQITRRAGVVDHQAAAFHRHRRVRLLVDRLTDHVRGRREHVVERRCGKAVQRGDHIGTVLFVHERVRVLGFGVIDHCGERVVVDVDELGRVFGERATPPRRRGPPDRRRSGLRPRRAGGAGLRTGPGRPTSYHCASLRGVQVGRSEHERTPGKRARPSCRCAGSGPGRSRCARSTRAASPGARRRRRTCRAR